MDCVQTDNKSVMDEPEGGSIVQADDTDSMLPGVANDGVLSSSGNNPWHWTSMLKLMEQGSSTQAPTTSFLCSTNAPSINTSYTTSACTSADAQQIGSGHVPPLLSSSVCSPSSSSLRDQPSVDMLHREQVALTTSDPDSSVWAQEFLSGPIGEQKSITNPCSADDGLQELFYPRTVLELLFSDQLKIEQMPSWMDILQAHGASTGSPTTGFTFPLASDKVTTTMPATHDKYVSGVDSPQFDGKVPHYVQSYNSHLLGTVDDRMSSSTASSTLSDNAIDQWPVPAASSSGPPCEAQPMVISSSQSMSSLMQQIDQPHVKQESIDQPLSPFNEKATGFEGSMMSNEYEQKLNNTLLISKLWSSGVNNANDPLLSHIDHKHHIYESITAANLSQNLRQAAGMTAASVCNLQTMNNLQDFGGGHLAGHSYCVHQPSDQQLEQKPLPFHDEAREGEGMATPNRPHEKERPTKRMARKVEGGINVYDMDTKQSMHHQSMAKTSPCSNIMLHQSTNKQEQLLGAEYSLKRSRVEQSMPPPSTSTSSTTNNSCAFKSQPVRKEKLGERITTLQQLISPFGKTDTASVLMEAIGYIKFLQDQVQALSSPYFKDPTSQNGEKGKAQDEVKQDLRSRGLCLVPLACTMHVANDNGADYWYGTSFR